MRQQQRKFFVHYHLGIPWDEFPFSARFSSMQRSSEEIIISLCCMIWTHFWNLRNTEFKSANFTFPKNCRNKMTELNFYCWTVNFCTCRVHLPTNAIFILKNTLKFTLNTHKYRSYIFRSSAIIRELALNLAKVMFMLKHSVKLGRYLLCGCVAARCHTTA